MKLEVGMYVRTDDGEIGKITHIETEIFSEPAYTLDIFTQGIYKGCKWFEGKASHNIIDLIEVGDYVNGYEVGFVDKEIKMVICYTANFNENEIDTILTKEQIKKMEYKVGE